MEIEIITLERFDVESKNIEKVFFDFSGLNSKIKLSRIYEISKDANKDYFKKIAEEMLYDPIVENFKLVVSDKRFFPGYKIFVKVSFKKGVTDVVGESVKKIISDMGYESPGEVKTSKGFYFSLNDKTEIINFIKENYANELIHNIVVEEI